jgi:hypothetical protein
LGDFRFQACFVTLPKRKKKKEPEMAFSTEIPSQEGATAV